MLIRIAATIILLLAASGATAQQEAAERVATFNDWSVYVAETNNGTVCFAVSQPQNTDPTGVDRGGIYFMLSNWPQGDIRNEASIFMGYPLEAESTVSVTIDNDESFTFLTRDDGAWLSDLGQDNDLIVAIQRGLEMVVRGRSQRGTNTTDTYSLRGATAAINGAIQECGG
jgi:hypothetical protein